MITPLRLRDVHEGIAPAWWPPAPGWWLVSAIVAVVVAVLAWRRLRRRRRAAAVARLFDVAVAAAETPAAKVAAISELLRRAARRHRRDAGTLEGDAWLALLDAGLPQPVFSTGAGAVIGDGGFRMDVTAEQAEALRALARRRYLDWMQGA